MDGQRKEFTEKETSNQMCEIMEESLKRNLAMNLQIALNCLLQSRKSNRNRKYVSWRMIHEMFEVKRKTAWTICWISRWLCNDAFCCHCDETACNLFFSLAGPSGAENKRSWFRFHRFDIKRRAISLFILSNHGRIKFSDLLNQFHSWYSVRMLSFTLPPTPKSFFF